MDHASLKTVLVVDDDQDMCWILNVALSTLGYEVTTVGSAQEALTLMADRFFSIGFIDARLPDMDGLRLIKALRVLQPTIRIIMVSGYYFEDDVPISEAAQADEIDGFLAKPFRIEAIAAALSRMGEGG
ncbi:response regulator [Bradyrhizobium liaoningense]